MRRRTFSCALLLALAAAASAAQQFRHVWLRVQPEGEEFAVHMPQPNFRVRRELPFGGGVRLRPASYELTYMGGLFSVLSFSKSAAGTPKSLGAFVEGFRHALGEVGVRSEPLSGREAGPDGRGRGELRLAAGGRAGVARAFETRRSFYVVLTLGGREAAAAAEHFQNSFTFDVAGADRVPLSEAADILRSPVSPPAPLWPVAGGMKSMGVARDEAQGEATPGGTLGGMPADVGPSRPAARKMGQFDVPLNARAIVKPQLAYPPIAKAARAHGTVAVQVLVDEEGYVIDARAVSGHPLLQQAAVFAARQTRFQPLLFEGRPVKVSGVITFNFVLG